MGNHRSFVAQTVGGRSGGCEFNGLCGASMKYQL